MSEVAAPAAHATLDVADPAEVAVLSRVEEKRDLVIAHAIVAERIEALKDLSEEKRTRLEALMLADGDKRLATPAAAACLEPKRKVSVVDPRLALEKLGTETLLEYFIPGVALVDALVARGITLASVGLQLEEQDILVIRRPQTAAAKKGRESAIERTKAETEATIARIMRRLKAPESGGL